jgi:hypothetical protein
MPQRITNLSNAGNEARKVNDRESNSNNTNRWFSMRKATPERMPIRKAI